jgi:hypothetical protein
MPRLAEFWLPPKIVQPLERHKAKSCWWSPLDSGGHVLVLFFHFLDDHVAWCYRSELVELSIHPNETYKVWPWSWKPQWVEFTLKPSGILREHL